MTDFLERLTDSLLGLLAFVPSLFGAAAVLTVGYVLAKLAQRGVGRMLRRMHLNDVLKRGGIPARDHTGQPVNPTRVVANLVFWLILFTAMLVAADALGIDYLGQIFSELLSYVPSVIAAVVIVILGIVLGDFVSALIAKEDLGTAVLVFTSCSLMLVIGGMRWWYLGILGGVGLMGAVVAVIGAAAATAATL